MATTIEQQPLTTSPVSVFGPIVFRASSNDTSGPKFRYVCRVKTGGGDLIAVLKVPPNAQDQGVFDVARILRDYLEEPVVLGPTAAPEYTSDIVTLTTAGYNPAGLFLIDIGSSEAPDEATPPTITYFNTNLKVNAVWFAGDEGDLRWTGSVALKGFTTAQWRCLTAGATTGVGWLTEIVPISETTQLGGVVLKQRCTLSDMRCHTFWYANNTGTGRTLGSLARVLKLAYYRTDTAAWVTESYTLSSELGVAATGVTTDAEMTGVAITGPGSIRTWGGSALGSLLTGGVVTTYEMRLYDGSNNPVSYNLKTEVVDSDCYNGSPVILGWVNRAGGWDYFNWTKKRVTSTKTEQATFYKDGGTWQQDIDFQPFTDTQGGKTTYKTNIQRTLQLTSDWVSDAEAVLLGSLYASDSVFVYQPDVTGAWSRVQVSDSGYMQKTTRNDRQFKYEIAVDLSKTRRTR